MPSCTELDWFCQVAEDAISAVSFPDKDMLCIEDEARSQVV